MHLKIDFDSERFTENNYFLAKKTLEVLYNGGITGNIDVSEQDDYSKLDNLIDELVIDIEFNLDWVLAFEEKTLKIISDSNNDIILGLNDDLKVENLKFSVIEQIKREIKRREELCELLSEYVEEE